MGPREFSVRAVAAAQWRHGARARRRVDARLRNVFLRAPGSLVTVSVGLSDSSGFPAAERRSRIPMASSPSVAAAIDERPATRVSRGWLHCTLFLSRAALG